MMTKIKIKEAIASNKKPPNGVTPLLRHFHQDLAVDIPELGMRKSTVADAGTAPYLRYNIINKSFEDKRLLTNMAIETAGFKWAPETVPIG